MKYLILFLSLATALAAQEQAKVPALKLREDAASAVRAKKELPEAALAKLRAHPSPSGLKIDRDADFALAAIDVGQRLISEGDPKAAEAFFREAVKALDSAIKKTSDTETATKAMFLRKRAWVNSNFLGRAKDALRDLESAMVLQPDDPQVQKARERLAKEHGPDFVVKKAGE